MNGADELVALRNAGFTGEEIAAHEGQVRKQLSDAGFNQAEINAHFGIKEADVSATKAKFDEATKTLTAEATKAEGGQRKAESFADYWEAGFGMSVPALMANKKLPDVALDPNAPWYARAVSSVGTLAGDLPVMGSAGIVGAEVGAVSANPIVPIVTGAGSAFAVPAMMRKELILNIQKGAVQNSQDIMDRMGQIAWEGFKHFIVGGLTSGTGAGVKVAAPIGKPLADKAAVLATEVTTMTTAMAAMEGRLPQPQEFVDAAVVIGGLKTVMALPGMPSAVSEARLESKYTKYVESKLHDIYVKTGRLPSEVVEDAKTDPTILQDLLSTKQDIPKAYEKILDPNAVEKYPDQRPVPEAEATVMARVAAKDVVKGIDIKAVANKAYTDLKNDLHPINQLVKALADGEKLDVAGDPGKLAQLMRGSFAKADHFLEFRPFEFKTLNNVGKSLKDIFEPHKDNLDGWRAFAVAKRAVELADRGIETGVDIESARAVAKAGEKKYGQSFKEVQEYQGHLINYLRDSGILSKESAAAILEANKDYVPFNRLMDPKETKGGIGGGLRVKQPIKAIKGSTRQILDPIESIIKNTYSYIELAERNRVGTTLVELAEKSPIGAELVKPVKTPMKPVRITDKELAKFMEENGIELPPDAADGLTVFRPGGFGAKPNEIVVFRDGKRQVFEVDPEVATAFNKMDRQSVSILLKVFSTPASLLRAGSVLSPDFMARNLIRDQLHAFILSEGGFVPLLDSFRGMAALLGKTEDFQAWLKSGGPNAALVNIDRQYIVHNVFKLDKQTDFIGKAWNVAKSPIEFLRVTSELIENSTRLGEFKKVTKGERDISTTFKGGLASREVTLDFARIGARTRAVNMIAAFFNAHVEGLDRVARAIQDNPGRVTMKAVAGITVPSVLLWWANKDDPRWKQIPRWQKDIFWIVMTDEHVYRIPKPFELGVVFGSLPERTLEAYFADNPRAMKDFEQTIMQQIVPDVVPTAASPVLEQWANKSRLTGTPVVPRDVEGMLPELQYSAYTSELTKAIGSMIRAVPGMYESAASSPALIDNYLRNWTGGLGNYALQLADYGLRTAGVLPDPVRPADTLADLPFIKAFVVRHPSANAQPIQDFYDRYDRNATILRSLKRHAENGDADAAMKLYEYAPDAMIRLDDTRAALGNMSKLARMIYKHPDMEAVEKRQIIDGLYYQMIQMAEQANTLMDQVEKDFRPK